MKSILNFRSVFASIVLIQLFTLAVYSADAPKPTLPGGNDKWRLVWSDEFDYTNPVLDNFWYAQNGSNTHILCSRWRENVVVSNGTVKLQNRKETRGGQNWTSGSISTKQQFKYGYYECRYKYAAATGTNNSFWLMTTGTTPTVGKKFEIDINEGHYPSEMATNIHNWTDITTNPTTGAQTHPSSSKKYLFGQSPDVTIQLELPVTARKVRLTSNYAAHFHIQEFRIYNVNAAGYPSAKSNTADTDKAGLVNFARDPLTKITSSGVYGTGWELPKVADGTLSNHWVSQTAGAKWLEFEFAEDKTIGCIQFVSGWISGSTYMSVLDDFKVQYYNGTEWLDIQSVTPTDGAVNFGKDYHYFGLEWTADSIKFYADGVLKRAEKNNFCYSAAPVYLSEAIISWAGAVTDAIDGTQMEVDYVRIYDPITTPNAPYDYVKNGGFEVTAAGSHNWDMTRDLFNSTVFSWLKTSPAVDLVSLRTVAETSTNPFAATLGQKVLLDSGRYVLRFKARATVATPEANKFVFKVSNMYSNKSALLNDSSVRVVVPTTDWKSYSYTLDLKQDFSAKLMFGFGNAGTFDLDSISLVRVGDVVLSTPLVSELNKAEIYSNNTDLIVETPTEQQLNLYTLQGSLFFSKKLTVGKHVIPIANKDLIIAQVRNKYGTKSKKIFIGK